MTEAFETNWMSIVGTNMNEVECMVAEKVGCKNAVALSSRTASLHLFMKLAGERLYGQTELGRGALFEHRVIAV